MQCCVWSSRSNIGWLSTTMYSTSRRAWPSASICGFLPPATMDQPTNQQFGDLRGPVMHTHTKLQQNRAIRSWVIATEIFQIWAPSAILVVEDTYILTSPQPLWTYKYTSVYQSSTQSSNAWLSYWRFNSFPARFTEGHQWANSF